MPEVVGRLRTPRLAAAPAAPTAGEVYYDTVGNVLYWWNGAAWVSASGGAPDLSSVPLLAPATDARNLFSGASGRLLVSGMVTGDANSRFTLDTSGALKWGPGNASADTALYRSGLDTLKTDDTFWAVTGLGVGTSVDPTAWASINATPTKDQLAIGGGTQYLRLGTDQGANTYITANAKHVGSGVWNYVNVAAYGGGAARLALSSVISFNVASGGVDPIAWSTVATIDATGLTFNASRTLIARGQAAAGTLTLATRVTGDTVDRFTLAADGSHTWGPGNATADVTLARSGSKTLMLTDTRLIWQRPVASDQTIWMNVVGDPGQARLYIRADGYHAWGDGTNLNDVSLSRPSGGQLLIQAATTSYTGTLTSGSAVVTTIASTTGILAGMFVSGTGIPTNATVLTVDSATQITLNANATVNGAQALSIGRPTLVLVKGSAQQGAQTLFTIQNSAGNSLLWLAPSGLGPSARIFWRYGSSLYEQDAGAGDAANRMIYQPNGDRFDILNEAGSLFTASLQTGIVKFYDGVANLDATNTPLTVIGSNVGIHQVAAVAGFGSGAGVIGIANATTVPSANPVGGGVLYVDVGVLKFRDPSGVVTSIAPGAAGAAEVNVSTAGPAARVGELLWVDTDDLGGGAAEVNVSNAGPTTRVTELLWVDTDDPSADQSSFPLLAPATDTRNRFIGDVATRLIASARIATDTVDRLTIDASGKFNWGPGDAAADVNLYRRAAYALQTDSNFWIGAALVIDAQGGGPGNKMYFGNALDTNLYRQAAYTLKTDATFQAVFDVYAQMGGATQVRIGNSSGTASLAFGSAFDTILYRAAAGIFRTDALLQIGGAGIGSGVLGSFLTTGDNNYRFLVNADGKVQWGPGVGAVDTNLYRAAPAWLETTSVFCLRTPAAGNYTFRILVPGDTNERFMISGNGLLYWGPGNAAQDVYIYRAGVGALSCSGTLNLGASLNASSSVVAMQATAYQQVLGNTYGYPGTGFANPPDTYFYRPAANTLNHYSGGWGTFNAGAFVVGSDRSIKSEIERHDVPVDALLRAGVYTYRLKGAEGRHLGLVSDELPDEVVSMTADPENNGGPEHRNVDLYKLMTALLATVQHLNERLTALETA